MKHLAAICIVLAMVGLALGYEFSLLWLWASLGLLWLIGHYGPDEGASTVGLVVFIGAAGYGVWQERPAGWLLVSVVAALAVWDLDHFERRLRQAETNEADLRRGHLQRLAVVTGLGLGLGLGLGWLALGVRVELSLGWAIILSLLAIVGLSRVLGFNSTNGD
jgi:hypothetical protein